MGVVIEVNGSEVGKGKMQLKVFITRNMHVNGG